MASERTLEEVQSAVEEFNERVAFLLSLKHNEPDDKGRTRIELERDRLNKISRNSWKRTKDPLCVGDKVSIGVGAPVGLALMDSYITEKPLQGILTNVTGLYGGDGYQQRSNKLIEPLFRVSVPLPQIEGQANPATVILLVPNDLLTKVVTLD